MTPSDGISTLMSALGEVAELGGGSLLIDSSGFAVFAADGEQPHRREELLDTQSLAGCARLYAGLNAAGHDGTSDTKPLITGGARFELSGTSREGIVRLTLTAA